MEAIALEASVALVDADVCNLCMLCVGVCPDEAICSEDIPSAGPASPGSRGVWVYAEQRRGHIASVVYELLGKGRSLADELGERLTAVVIGARLGDGPGDLIQFGADRVLVVDDPALEDFNDEPYAAVLTALIREERPEMVLAGATALGRSFIPKVATQLRTGLTADCTGLEIDSERRLLLQTRPAYGGSIMATIVCESQRPQMCTVRHKVMDSLPRDGSRTGEMIRKDCPADARKAATELLKFVEEKEETASLTEADIIVSGGRGLGDPKNFILVRELAMAIGGAVGASRAVVDAGWVSYPHQVGQTGKTVKPKIYIACGISGAVQHLVGMQSSDMIIAINKDPDAPIFNVATYGIVGDLFEVLPALTSEFGKLR